MAAKGILQPSSPVSTEPGAFLLETDRLILRRVSISYAPALASAGNHAAVARNLRNGFPFPYTLADAEAFLSSAVELGSTTYPLHCATFVKPETPGNPSSEPLYIGAMGIIPKSDVYYRTWEIGYWLTPSSWGKGYATELLRAFTRWVFQTWPDLNRVEAVLYARNIESERVLKKCGFVQEGRRRGAVEKAGEIMDEVIYGLLKDDLEEA